MMTPIRSFMRNAYSAYVYDRQCASLRKDAISLLDRISRKRNGTLIVDKQLKKSIQNYCKTTFGSTSYWPWLAVYTELRGEFIEGWIPVDYFRYNILYQLNPIKVSYISMYKTLDYRIFADLCVKPLLIIMGRLIYDSNYHLISMHDARLILKNFDREVVVKSDGGRGGKQVVFYESSKIAIDNLVGTGSFLIQPVIKQHANVAEVNPVSTNTLRILTYLDITGKVHTKSVILKFGINDSRVDNLSAGGRFVYLDHDGHVVSDAYVDRGISIERSHPTTGKLYKDIQVPSIPATYDLCIKAHRQYPYVGLIGWDVIIDADGVPKILEWNAYQPAMYYHEALKGPLFDTNELNDIIRWRVI